MDLLIKRKAVGNEVYDFMMEKKAEGKPYYVYITAGLNRFLRKYYGKVKEYLGKN